MSEAEVDRQTPSLLLGEAVGIGAGEGQHERRLAVVDVAGGRDHAHDGELRAADLPSHSTPLSIEELDVRRRSRWRASRVHSRRRRVAVLARSTTAVRDQVADAVAHDVQQAELPPPHPRGGRTRRADRGRRAAAASVRIHSVLGGRSSDPRTSRPDVVRRAPRRRRALVATAGRSCARQPGCRPAGERRLLTFTHRSRRSASTHRPTSRRSRPRWRTPLHWSLTVDAAAGAHRVRRLAPAREP